MNKPARLACCIATCEFLALLFDFREHAVDDLAAGERARSRDVELLRGQELENDTLQGGRAVRRVDGLNRLCPAVIGRGDFGFAPGPVGPARETP